MQLEMQKSGSVVNSSLSRSFVFGRDTDSRDGFEKVCLVIGVGGVGVCCVCVCVALSVHLHSHCTVLVVLLNTFGCYSLLGGRMSPMTVFRLAPKRTSPTTVVRGWAPIRPNVVCVQKTHKVPQISHTLRTQPQHHRRLQCRLNARPAKPASLFLRCCKPHRSLVLLQCPK